MSDKKTGDDYLADIIRHTAATGGSAGTVLSLAGEYSTANRFLHSNRSLVQIDTHLLPGRFKSAAQILLEDGNRLIDSGKVSVALVRKALENLLSEMEEKSSVWTETSLRRLCPLCSDRYSLRGSLDKRCPTRTQPVCSENVNGKGLTCV